MVVITGMHGGKRGKNNFADYYTYEIFTENKLCYNVKKFTVGGECDMPVIPPLIWPSLI